MSRRSCTCTHVAGLKYIFLVGGFAESPMLQLEVRNAFSDVATILVPSEAGLTILKGSLLLFDMIRHAYNILIHIYTAHCRSKWPFLLR